MSKRNTAGAGSIRRRADGRWEARYTAGVDPSTGKQIQRSIYGKTQQEVRQKLTKVTAEIDEGTYIAPSKMTVTQWLDLWLETYVHHAVKQHTYEAYERDIRNCIKPAIGKVSLSSLDTLQIQQFYNSLSERGLSPKTVKNVHGVLHEALERAVKLRKVKYNPTDGTELPKVQRKPIHPLEDEAILAFLEAIKGVKYERLFYVDLFSGLREGEILGLTWDCVDFDRNQLFVNKQLQKTKKVGGEYELTSTKNSRCRTVIVAASVMTALKTQQQWQEKMKLMQGDEWKNVWDLVFTHENGAHLCPFTVYIRFKEIVRKLGLPEVRFHDLRHTFAVLSLENGDDLKTLQDNLGHATASFTLDVYGHVSQRMRQQSADRMEQFILSQEGKKAC